MSDIRFRVNVLTFSSLFCLAIGFTAVLADNATDDNTAVSASNTTANCSLVPLNGTVHKIVAGLLKSNTTYLIRYTLTFPKLGSNPLVKNYRYIYKPDSYSRIRKRHGQTLLSLAFNYGVISLMTLNFGTSDVTVNVTESPVNCLTGLSEDEALNVVLYLLARDLDLTKQAIALHDEQRVCLQYIVARNGLAYFKPRCYSGDKASSMADPEEIGNKWIDGIYLLMTVVKFLLICFGPLILVKYVSTLSQEATPYIVKLKEPLVRTLFIAKNMSDFANVRGNRILNLSKCRGYPKLRQTLENAPFGRPFVAEISEYDILARGDRLIKENEVPITFWGSISEAIFRCKVKNVGPMQSCCYVDMFQDFSCVKKRIPWISFWRKVGMALLMFFLPFLYYLRLILFYLFENEELTERRDAAARLGLTNAFDNSLVLYFSPTHWAFIFIYCIYFVSAFILAYLTRSDNEGRFRSILVGSFADLRRLSYLRVFQLMVENFLWPFKRYGILGCLVAIVYWPIVLPLTLIVYLFYSIPTIYLTLRMLFYSRRNFLEQIRTRSGVRKYQTSEKEDNNLNLFQADYLFGAKEDQLQPVKLSEANEEVDELEKFRTNTAKEKEPDDKFIITPKFLQTFRVRPSRFFPHLLASIMCILCLYSLLVIVAECLGSLVEIGVFTMMGVVVNAGVSVKYAALVCIVIVYSYDCFNNVQVRYYKLNKALFLELKGRIKGLDIVTSLPSHLQENQGFKSQEQSEQAAHEVPDNIAEQPSRHWFINDLVLFVDNEDTFRIPRRLFRQVVEIRVAGVPGPIYEGMLEALYHFLKLLTFVIFVFLVVLSFGDIYELSSTTQMMAVLATGFLPIVLKSFMEPQKPEVEVNSLSFKSKLDEVIKNFWQLWPIHDFAFKALPDPDPVPTEATTTTTNVEQTPADEKKEEEAAAQQITEIHVTENMVTENQVAGNKAGVKPKETVKEPAKDVASSSAEDTRGSKVPWVKKSLGKFNPSGGHEQTPIRSPSSVKLDKTHNNNSTATQVDLLIRLPLKYEDEWVDGWSNIIEVKGPRQKQASEVAENMMEDAASKVQGND